MAVLWRNLCQFSVWWRAWFMRLKADFLLCNKLWSTIIYMFPIVGWKWTWVYYHAENFCNRVSFSITLNFYLRKWWNYSDQLNFLPTHYHICVVYLIMMLQVIRQTLITRLARACFRLSCVDSGGCISESFLLCLSFGLNLSFSVFLSSVYLASLDFVITLDYLQWFKSSDCVFGWIIMSIAFDQILVRYPRDFALLFDCVCYLKINLLHNNPHLMLNC